MGKQSRSSRLSQFFRPGKQMLVSNCSVIIFTGLDDLSTFFGKTGGTPGFSWLIKNTRTSPFNPKKWQAMFFRGQKVKSFQVQLHCLLEGKSSPPEPYRGGRVGDWGIGIPRMLGKVSLEVTEAQDVALEDVLVRMHTNETEQPEARQKNQTQLKRQPPKALPSGKLT